MRELERRESVTGQIGAKEHEEVPSARPAERIHIRLVQASRALLSRGDEASICHQRETSVRPYQR